MGEINRGAVQLPRFQRQVVWSHELVEGFLQAILDKHPLGVFLVLEVNPHKQPFKIRPIDGASNGSERCRQHLLDGQQRLTALWSAFMARHASHAFYIEYEKDINDIKQPVEVAKAVSKKGRDKNILGNPAQEYAKHWIPIEVVSPAEVGGVQAAIEWRKRALQDVDDDAARIRVETLIERLRSHISSTPIPYFSLPQETSEQDAIEIFIRTNSSSVRLTQYDLAVAQMEEKTDESLEEKKEDLIRRVPLIGALEGENSVGDLILKLQCLREQKKPTLSSYRHLDFSDLNAAWETIVEGVDWAVRLLDDIHIRRQNRLPTAVPLRVLPLLAAHIPKAGAPRDRAMRLVRRYLWAAFLTDRYDRQANDRLKQDYDMLGGLLCSKRDVGPETPILEGADSPTADELQAAGWPGRKSRLGRAVLAACSLEGAHDVGSNDRLTDSGAVDLHHIFPKAILRAHDGADPHLAMNCMLMHSPTNREWSKRLPGDYLIHTIKAAGASAAVLADAEAARRVAERLNTHCVPPDELLTVREGCADVAAAYRRFVGRRARIVEDRIACLFTIGSNGPWDGPSQRRL